MAPPAERAASSTRRNKSTLAAFPIVDGSILMGLTIREGCVVSAITLVPPPPWRAASAATRAAAINPASERSAVCANPVVSPAMTRIPAPRFRPVESCSIFPSSRPTPVPRQSEANTSAKSAPVRKPSANTRSRMSLSITWQSYIEVVRVVLCHEFNGLPRSTQPTHTDRRNPATHSSDDERFVIRTRCIT